jgi:hypothetical protein
MTHRLSAGHGPKRAEIDDRSLKHGGRLAEPPAPRQHLDTCSNAIGTPYLTAHWKDPVVDPRQRAFYYVRVLEISTPRWTTCDARFFGVKLPADVPSSIQGRAYSSPIWYMPQQ